MNIDVDKTIESFSDVELVKAGEELGILVTSTEEAPAEQIIDGDTEKIASDSYIAGNYFARGYLDEVAKSGK